MGVTKSADNAVDTSGWLLRSQAADLLDVSHTTIKNWDGTLLHPIKERRSLPNGGSREVWIYDPRELSKIPAARRQRAKMMPGDSGEVAARAFELFDEGLAAREVVIRLRESPESVEKLRDQWHLLGGSELVLHRIAREELTRLVGSFDGVAGLVARLRELLPDRSTTPVVAMPVAAKPADAVRAIRSAEPASDPEFDP